MRNQQTIFLVVLFCLFSIAAGFALAQTQDADEENKVQLELSYPSLPFLGPLRGGEDLGWYARYFFNLTFFIALGVCVLVIIWGGVLRLSPIKRTATIIRSNEAIKRGFLGLLVLVLSYAILALINPELLILRFDKEGFPATMAYANKPPQPDGLG